MGLHRTWSQRERRYRPDRPEATRALQDIPKHLKRLTYESQAVRSRVVTVYLDSPERHYLSLAESSDGRRTLKTRLREYVWTDADGANHHAPTCYLERKERIDEVRLKQRIEIDKSLVGPLLRREQRLPADSPEAKSISSELDALKLEPVLVSVYERQVFGTAEALRITFDERLGYYLPPESLYGGAAALTPEVLGKPIGRGPSRILEIKFPADSRLPDWIEKLVAGMPNAQGFSKFRDGMRAVDDGGGAVARLTRPISILAGDS